MFIRKLGWSSLLVAVLLTLTAVTGWAEQCSLQTLKGSYGFSVDGTLVAPPLPFVTSGIIVFDGNGSLSGEGPTSFNGVVIPGTFTGTYTVNPDCTYLDELNSGFSVVHDAGTIVGDGMFREVDVIETDPGIVSFGTYRKTPVGRCSLATLKGTYGVVEHGMVVASNPSFPPIPPPFLVTLSANPTFDGAGNVSGTYTAGFGGFTGTGKFAGTYEVTPDCAYSDELVAHPTGESPLPPIHHTGVITGEGMLQGVVYIYSDEGTVISGTAKKQ